MPAPFDARTACGVTPEAKPREVSHPPPPIQEKWAKRFRRDPPASTMWTRLADKRSGSEEEDCDLPPLGLQGEAVFTTASVAAIVVPVFVHCTDGRHRSLPYGHSF
ncbi:hypothetical protein GCM10011583_64460 [Streptomyces camponoticapitis]|uniref:Uncharacterized protein n=1 Tax=Streptomyces camponoticapitis TaxID=1616125 RepID=A0ABQ2ET94_9ACTN|nr:hypothetical protein GCM10011583_64460 [Streptomyces camponoticapitis]